MLSIIVSPIGHSRADTASFQETCYLDDSYVILYKITNWWNDSRPEDDRLICGNRLKCELKGMTQVHYDRVGELLTIQSSYGIESIVSIFPQCKRCSGVSSLYCTYLNPAYFKTALPHDVSEIDSSINRIQISGVAYQDASRLMDEGGNLVVELEGVVRGLLAYSGKIALHNEGDFLKSCPNSFESGNLLETSVTVRYQETDDILMRCITNAGGQ